MASKISLSRRTLWFTMLCCLFAGAMLFNVVQQVYAKEEGEGYRFLKSFTDVLALVQKNYVEDVSMKDLVEGAIKGMLLTLDPHSGYLANDMYEELQVETKGEFGGLGIEITVKDGLLTVVTPIEDSPAAKAGVRPGDQIIKIADEFTKHLSLVEAVKKMRGPKGTPITLSIFREGRKDLIPITVIRDVIKVKSIRSRMLENGVGYVRLAQFQEGSAKEFVDALEKLKQENKGKTLEGLVLDVRNNPGGLLTQAIRVSDIFLTEGIIVYTDGRLESQKQKYFAHDDKREPEYPIVVLINGGSASASEIVAGALQDHGRALILGTKSFGKGSVQTILPMENGTALRLTTALYYTKNGRSIQAEGIAPDVVVSQRRFPKDSEELLEEDEQEDVGGEKSLPRAIKNPLKKGEEDSQESEQKGKTKKGKEEAELESEPMLIGSHRALTAELSELLKEDHQLDDALKLLKTWKVFGGVKKPGEQMKAPVAEASASKAK